MIWLHLFILSVGVIGLSEASANYCIKSLCKEGPHICCANKKFASSCVKPKQIQLSADDKKTILNLANTVRNNVAGGNERGFSSSREMSVLVYDEELAFIASCNGLPCTFAHDKCRNTQKYNHVGQNIWISHTQRQCIDVKAAIKRGIDVWTSEKQHCTMKRINDGLTEGVGHFSQLVHGRAAKIGCAITQWWDKALKTCSMYFVCNFNEGNMRSYSVYDSGRAASGCNNGPHPIFKYLCNVNERYDDFKKCVQAKKH